MALFDRLKERVVQRARVVTDRRLRQVGAAMAKAPGILLRREGDELILAGRGMMRRWLSDDRLRFALWSGR